MLVLGRNPGGGWVGWFQAGGLSYYWVSWVRWFGLLIRLILALLFIIGSNISDVCTPHPLEPVGAG